MWAQMWATGLISGVVRPLRATSSTARASARWPGGWAGGGDTRSLYVARGGLRADVPKDGASGGARGGANTPGKRGAGAKTPKGDSLVDHPARLQYSSKVELGINEQIVAELNASYYYTSLASSFGRVDVALRGLERFFWRTANQERNDAINLADYQNKRGGIVRVNCIDDPGPTARTTSAREALANSLQLQRNLTQQLLNLYQVANDCCDPVTCDFLSESFLLKQVKRLSRNGRYLTQLSRIGETGIALHDFDEWLFNDMPGKADVHYSLSTKHLSEYPNGKDRGKS